MTDVDGIAKYMEETGMAIVRCIPTEQLREARRMTKELYENSSKSIITNSMEMAVMKVTSSLRVMEWKVVTRDYGRALVNVVEGHKLPAEETIKRIFPQIKTKERNNTEPYIRLKSIIASHPRALAECVRYNQQPLSYEKKRRKQAGKVQVLD